MSAPKITVQIKVWSDAAKRVMESAVRFYPEVHVVGDSTTVVLPGIREKLTLTVTGELADVSDFLRNEWNSNSYNVLTALRSANAAE